MRVIGRVRIAIAVLVCATAQPAAAQVTGVHIGLVTTDIEHLPRMDSQDEFLTTDPAVQYVVTTSGGKGNKLRVEWWNPLGQNVEHGEWPIPSGSGYTTSEVAGISEYPGAAPLSVSWRLKVAGSRHAYDPGEWQVRTYWNDVLVDATKFRISLPPDGPVQVPTPSVFPIGTFGEPYYLQLTARGGTPPYHWTELKALPTGLALSPNGSIAGTPREISGARVVVKADDSAGHSTTRTFGLQILPPADGVRLLSRSLLKSTGTDTCPEDALQNDFAASDAGITLAARIETDHQGMAIEWLNPRGEAVQRWEGRKTQQGPQCFVNTLAVAGHPAASDPGEWRVRFHSGGEVFTIKFTISAGERVAFLLANRAYQKLPAAGTPDGDVRRIETTLRDDGFRVNVRTNLTLDDLTAFEKSLDREVHSGDTVFVYYAGYAIPAGGDAWLVPVNYDPGDTRPIQARAYSVQRLRDLLEDRKAKLKFLVLDAALRGAGKGLDSSAADASTAIIQSTGPHSGAFARALADVLAQPGTDAQMALEVALPKAAAAADSSMPRPLVFIGGAGSFVFHGPAASR